MNTVFILGAGFSKAIGQGMPTLAELSCLARSELASGDHDPIPGGGTRIAEDFEAWLSYLLEGSPWLSEGDRYRNRAAFSDLVASIHRVLETAQSAVVAGVPPPWLDQLVEYWQAGQAQIITFNYDLLVEMAWLEDRQGVRHASDVLDLFPVPLTYAKLRTGAPRGHTPAEAGMRLYKLHGSLNWWYSGDGSPPGDPVYIEDTPKWGGLVASKRETYYTVDKLPLILAPTAIKSSYYTNGVIRSLWAQSAAVIRAADQLVLMGFSVPPSDLTCASLLSTELKEGTSVVPVNLTEEVVDRLSDLLGDGYPITRDYIGEGSIENWVAQNARS